MIARCPCTPLSIVETFGEKISTDACSGIEIACLLKKKKKDEEYDDMNNREIACERILAQ